MNLTIQKEIAITDDMQSNLLCDAFEGGSNYWIQGVAYYYKGKHMTSAQIRKAIKGLTLFDSSMVSKDIEDPLYIWLPLIEGGELWIVVSDEGDKYSNKEFKLNKDQLALGMIKFANSRDYKHHFQNFVDENDDAITGDVFLQMCLFGDVIYG